MDEIEKHRCALLIYLNREILQIPPLFSLLHILYETLSRLLVADDRLDCKQQQQKTVYFATVASVRNPT